MHIGNHNDPKVKYFVQGCQLDEYYAEKGLDVLISRHVEVGS